MQQISTKKIGVFISAADAGSFTEGSRRSNISQPATVSIIDEIESAVGEELFVRAGKARRAKLTPRGMEVYETFVRAKAIYEQALESIGNPKRRRSAQTVLIQMPYASAVSMDWLRRLISGFEHRRVCIRSAERSEIIKAVEKREACMALIDGEFRPKDREYWQIASSEMVLVTSNGALFGDINVDMVDWGAVPKGTFIYTGINPTASERVYDNLKRMSGAGKDQFTEVNCPSILRSFTEQFEVTAIVPRIMAKCLQAQSNRLRCLQFSQLQVHISLGLLIPFGSSPVPNMSRLDLGEVLDQKLLS